MESLPSEGKEHVNIKAGKRRVVMRNCKENARVNGKGRQAATETDSKQPGQQDAEKEPQTRTDKSHLDLFRRGKSVELVQQLQHGALHLAIAGLFTVETLEIRRW